jgi:hypothetical protein
VVHIVWGFMERAPDDKQTLPQALNAGADRLFMQLVMALIWHGLLVLGKGLSEIPGIG